MVLICFVVGCRYGAVLNLLQGRDEVVERIVGCVVDSGGDPELDPKVKFYLVLLFDYEC